MVPPQLINHGLAKSGVDITSKTIGWGWEILGCHHSTGGNLGGNVGNSIFKAPHPTDVHYCSFRYVSKENTDHQILWVQTNKYSCNTIHLRLFPNQSNLFQLQWSENPCVLLKKNKGQICLSLGENIADPRGSTWDSRQIVYRWGKRDSTSGTPGIVRWWCVAPRRIQD